MSAQDGSARSSPPGGSLGPLTAPSLDPSPLPKHRQPSNIQNIMVLQCDSLRCCLLARDVADILPYQGPGGCAGTAPEALSSRHGSLPICRLSNLIDPEEYQLVRLIGGANAPPMPAQTRAWIVLLERSPGVLGLLALHVKLVLHVNLERACRPAPPIPGCSRLALAWLELGGSEMPLLSVEALLWRHRARSRARDQVGRLMHLD